MKIVKSNSNLFPSVFSDLFDMGKYFDRFPSWRDENWLPAANVKEDDKSYEISLAVPGMQKENIKLEIENQMLTVSGERKEEKKEEKDSFVMREYQCDSFSRSFSLSDKADEDTIKAQYEDGILKIMVGKKEAEIKNPKKVLTVQ